MFVRLVLVILLAAIPGCASTGNEAAGTPAASSVDQRALGQWREEMLAHGREVYYRQCASCHEPGAGAAPATGVQADWDDRSRMWTAVLTEHARLGYLQMPAQGGNAALSDREVAAASEYMLSVTYPELPID